MENQNTKRRRKLLAKKIARKCPILSVNIQALLDCMECMFKTQKFNNQDIWSLRCSCKYFDAVVRLNCNKVVQIKIDHGTRPLASINILLLSVDILHMILQFDLNNATLMSLNSLPACMNFKTSNILINLEFIHVYTQHKLEEGKIYAICGKQKETTNQTKIICGKLLMKPASCLIHNLHERKPSCVETECHIWKCICGAKFRVSRAIKDKTPKFW